ncbi:hypothetical protein DRP04_01495 [Archaeoglobales archaeon]|nr:MAG: hypothetical protein DRP04_01495 [Archaeoglobales archaeon]HDN74032.1 DUF1152 domain-containing protein [Archaeoglobus sp.]
MEIMDNLKDVRRALVFGIGGGGDIASTIPVANFLKKFGIDVLYGSVVWDRLVVDPKPGPRSLDELEEIEKINDLIGFAFPKTRTKYGIKPNVARAAEHFGKVVAIDITKGPKSLANALRNFSEKLDVSLFVGVDAGGDAISVGFESGVKSPLSDATCVSALKDVNGIVAVFGFGSDGELRFEELLLNISEIIKMDGFLGCTSMSKNDYKEMKEITKFVVTEASSIPIMAFEGEFGVKKIRKSRTVLISPLCILTFYFKAESVFKINQAARIIEEAKNLEEANRLLNRNGILTELDFERAITLQEDR